MRNNVLLIIFLIIFSESTALAQKVPTTSPPQTSGQNKPGSMKPGSMKPGSTKPGPTKPGPTKPGPTKPGPTKPTSIYVLPDSVSFSADGGERTIEVESSRDWTISNTYSWISSDRNKKSLRLKVEPNTSSSDREGEIELSSSGRELTKKIKVFQYANEKVYVEQIVEQRTSSDEDDWNHCDTKSKKDLLVFLEKHPQSRFATRAKYHLNIINGVDAYNLGNYNSAFYYLTEAKKESPLDGEALHVYELAQQKIFAENQSTTNETRKDEYNNGRMIESDNDAKAKNKSKQSLSFGSWLKGRVLFGIKIDAEKNIYEPSWAFNGGLVLKFGKHTDLFNLLVGVDFRFYVFNKFPKKKALADVAQDAYITGGQIIVPFTVKFNLLRITNSWSMYIGGACNIQNKVRDNFNILKPHSVSFEPQIGLVSRHWDIGANFKKFAKTPYFIDCRSNYLGVYSVFYF